MANSTIMLAAAGSGKTYHIAEKLDPFKKNLIITYTRQNVANLRKEVINRFGELPKNTQVLTFSSFIYRWLLKPFEPILIIGSNKDIITDGVDIKNDPPQQRINGKYNYKYKEQKDFRHYLYNNKYYSSRMSKLILKQPAKVRKQILERLSKFTDYIFFDELQDFMGEDFNLLNKIFKEKSLCIFAVGDFHQHSVSKSNFNTTKPFKKGNEHISKDDYKSLFHGNIDIDEDTLKNSRRVPKNICEFINTKLGISIYSVSTIKGHYELLTEEKEIYTVLEDNDIKKLLFKESSKYSTLSTVNWSYSKGDTYEKSCIILTSTFESLFEDSFNATLLTPTQINPLYVAMTRATHELYFIKASDFRKVRPHYYN